MGAALRQRSGFIEHDRGHGASPFQHLGVADQKTAPRRDASRGHDRGRRRKAERARAGDDEHRDRVHGRRFGAGPRDQPAGERHKRNDDHHRHEHRADPVGEALHGGFRRLRALDHADDAGERGFRAPRRHVDDKPAIEVQTPGNDFPGGGLVDRRALARDERLINAGRPLDDDPISRQALAGADQDALAFRQFLNRDFGFNAVPDDAGGRRREPFEGRQGGHGLARRPLLQPFAEQHEGDDDGGALEVEVRRVAGGGGRRDKG